MRSLFVRIFLSFWLAIILIAVGSALIYALDEPQWWQNRGRFLTSQALQLHGEQILELRRADRLAEAEALDHEFQRRVHIQTVLFDSMDDFTGSDLVPPVVRDLARSTAETGELQEYREGGFVYHIEPLRSPASVVVDESDGSAPASAVIVGRLERPPTWSRILGRPPFGLRFLVMFVVSGLVCFWLARQVTRPIDQLRNATRALANEDLEVRVTPELGRRGDEIAALGRDFDAMADRIQTLLEDQRRLLRDVSHELRSPLARLSVALELARQADGEGNGGRQLDRIGREAERLNELIGHMLSVAQLEARAAGGEKQPVDLRGIVESVVGDANFETQANEGQVALVAPDSVEVLGVEELLHRAVENVVRNAVRFTAEGTTVDVSLRCEANASASTSRTSARLVVRDHGPGVPDEDLERIFQPFVRVGEARDRKSGGTGIGLAVAQRAVSLHHGTIEARNVEDGGLEVTISLPCCHTAAQSRKQQSSAEVRGSIGQ